MTRRTSPARDRSSVSVQTIESVIPLGARRLGVLNDNNYPVQQRTHPGEPDANEFIIIRLDRQLPN